MVTLTPWVAGGRAEAAPIGWSVSFGSSGDDHLTATATNAKGEIAVTGWTDGNLAGATNGFHQAFVAKFDKLGNQLWIRQLAGVDHVEAYGVAIGSKGEVYITGDATGNFDGQNSAGLDDGFLTAYDKNGTKLWTRLIGTTSYEASYAVAVKGSAVYVTGITGGTLGATSFGGPDAWVARFDDKGNRKWLTQVGNGGNEGGGHGIAVSSNGKDVYIVDQTSAFFTGFTDLDGNGADVYVAKLNAAKGTLTWVQQIVGDATSNFDAAQGLAIGKGGKVYVTGGTNGNFSPASLQGAFDSFLAVFTTAGVRTSMVQFGTADVDEGTAVAIASTGDPVVVGQTSGAFTPNAYLGASDVSVTRFTQAGAVVASRQLATTESDADEGSLPSVAAGAAGAVIVGGSSEGVITGFSPAGGFDAFLVVVPKILP